MLGARAGDDRRVEANRGLILALKLFAGQVRRRQFDDRHQGLGRGPVGRHHHGAIGSETRPQTAAGQHCGIGRLQIQTRFDCGRRQAIDRLGCVTQLHATGLNDGLQRFDHRLRRKVETKLRGSLCRTHDVQAQGQAQACELRAQTSRTACGRRSFVFPAAHSVPPQCDADAKASDVIAILLDIDSHY